jgi:hypothetical protein
VISLFGLLACVGPPTDSDSRPPPADFQVTSVDRDSYKAWDYKLQTFTLHLKAAATYDSLFPDALNDTGQSIDYRPSFYLLRPKDTSLQPPAVLFYLHGGTIGDDREFPTQGSLPDVCQADAVLGLSKDKIDQQLMPLAMAAERGWLVVIPRNDWCDYWLGQGPLDSTAPWHYGGVHFERVLDFLEEDLADLVLPERRFLWGSSAGGGAATHLAVRHGGFQAIVADSSPADLFILHSEAPDALELQFGGPPWTESGAKSVYWSGYADASPHTLIASGALQTPLFLVWNTQDRRADPAHGTGLIEAMDTHYSPADIRWGNMDLNHPSPGEHFHVQANRPALPAAATAFALLDFLEGADLKWFEAESACEENGGLCDVGRDIHLEADSPESTPSLSQASGRQALPEDGPGTLWSVVLPEALPTTQSHVAQAVFKVSGESELPTGTLLGRLVLSSSLQHIELPLELDAMAPSAQARRTEVIAQLRASRLAFELAEGEQATLRLEVSGEAEILLDAVILASSDNFSTTSHSP